MGGAVAHWLVGEQCMAGEKTEKKKGEECGTEKIRSLLAPSPSVHLSLPFFRAAPQLTT